MICRQPLSFLVIAGNTAVAHHFCFAYTLQRNCNLTALLQKVSEGGCLFSFSMALFPTSTTFQQTKVLWLFHSFQLCSYQFPPRFQQTKVFLHFRSSICSLITCCFCYLALALHWHSGTSEHSCSLCHDRLTDRLTFTSPENDLLCYFFAAMPGTLSVCLYSGLNMLQIVCLGQTLVALSLTRPVWSLLFLSRSFLHRHCVATPL